MDENSSYRRAFSIGLLTLSVALGGQMATSQAAPQCSVLPRRLLGTRALYARVAPRIDSGLAQRVARAVIGAVLNGFI